MKTLLVGVRILALTTFILVCHQALAQNQPPFCIGLNFPFVGPSNATIADIFTNIPPLGLRGIRQIHIGNRAHAFNSNA
jgi:hypothetical protein